MNANLRNFALWVIIVLLLLALFTLFQNPGTRTSAADISFSQLLTDVDQGKVRDVTIQGPEIHGTYTDGRAFNTYAPNDNTLVQRLYGKGVQITARPPGENVPWFVSLLVSWLPFIALIGVWIFLSRQMQGAGGKALGFGKSRAKLLTEAHGRVTFEDVAGVDEAKQDLQGVRDAALLRPGRFDRQVVVPNPDVVGREQILKVHVRKVPLAPDVNLKTIARGTPGFSGADLANLINEAALMAARRNKRMVTQAEFEDAKDKVMMGAERKSLVMTEEEKLLTAYHEGGHAIVALNVVATDPVHKATIIPRGRALGMVMQLPERDKLSMTYEQMTSRLAIMMGGRVAEEMIFGKEKVTSGAQSDIEQATRLARMMVTRWGFSPELGAVSYGENQDEVFLGMSVARQQNVSESTAQKIDAEVKRLVEEGHSEARRILEAKRSDLEVLAKGLLEFETMSGDEIKDLLVGKRPIRESVIEPATPRSSAVPSAGKGRPPQPDAPLDPQPAPQA